MNWKKTVEPTNVHGVQVVSLEHDHWNEVCEIYAQGIATGQATFETEVPDWESWNQAHLPFARFVAIYGSQVAGWGALSPVSDRCAYRGVAEVSVYVAESSRGRGIGSVLLRRIILASEAEGIWTLQAGIFPENARSVKLHRRAGFREVGRREKLGRLNGRWRDVLLLERRSRLVDGEDDGAAADIGDDAPSGGGDVDAGSAHHHTYTVQVTWTGNRGHGTETYRGYSRAHEVGAPGKPVLRWSADPVFRGDVARYNPEEMLVASLSACHMLWYLHLCADAGVAVTAYMDRPWGDLTLASDGSGQFREVVLRPVVRLVEGGDVEMAERLHEAAHSMCFIANSVRFPVRCDPTVEPASGHSGTARG